jgi:hypothetical protein
VYYVSRGEKTMIDFRQFREHVVQRTLRELDDCIPYSEEAVDLLMMTAAHESKGGTFLKQVQGPALGVYQMEPTTHEDIWDNYLEYNRKLEVEISGFLPQAGLCYEELIANLTYSTAMARVHYFRVPEALPVMPPLSKCIDLRHQEGLYLWELAEYAKKHYNTVAGKATPEKYYQDYLAWRGN